MSGPTRVIIDTRPRLIFSRSGDGSGGVCVDSGLDSRSGGRQGACSVLAVRQGGYMLWTAAKEETSRFKVCAIFEKRVLIFERPVDHDH